MDPVTNNVVQVEVPADGTQSMAMQTQTTNKTSLNLSKEEIILVDEQSVSNTNAKTPDYFPINTNTMPVSQADSVYEPSMPLDDKNQQQLTQNSSPLRANNGSAEKRQNSVGSADYEQSLAPVQQVVPAQQQHQTKNKNGGDVPTIEPIIISTKNQIKTQKPPNTSQGNNRVKMYQKNQHQMMPQAQLHNYLSNQNNDQVAASINDTGEQQTFASMVEGWTSKDTSAGAQTAPWSRQQAVRNSGQQYNLQENDQFVHPKTQLGVSAVNFGPFKQFIPPSDLSIQPSNQIVVQPRKAMTRNCAREKKTIESILADTQSSNLPTYLGQHKQNQAASQGRYRAPVSQISQLNGSVDTNNKNNNNIAASSSQGHGNINSNNNQRAGSMQPFVNFEEFSDFQNFHSSAKQSEQPSEMTTPKPLYTLTLQNKKNAQKSRLVQTNDQKQKMKAWNLINYECQMGNQCPNQQPQTTTTIGRKGKYTRQRMTPDPNNNHNQNNFRQSVQQPATVPLFGQSADQDPHHVTTRVSQDESITINNHAYQTVGSLTHTNKQANKQRYCSISPSIHATNYTMLSHHQNLDMPIDNVQKSKIFAQQQHSSLNDSTGKVKKRAKTRLESLGNSIKIGTQPGAMIRQETKPFIKKRQSIEDSKYQQTARVQDSICNPDYLDYQTTGLENSIDAGVLLQQNSEFLEESAIFSSCNEHKIKVKGTLEIGQSIQQVKEKSKAVWGAESVNKKLKKLYGDLITNQTEFNLAVTNDQIYSKKTDEFLKLVEKQRTYLESCTKETQHMFLPREQKDCMREVDVYYQGMIRTMSTYIERQEQKYDYNMNIQKGHIKDLETHIETFYEQQRKAQEMMDSVNKDIEASLKLVDQYNLIAELKNENMTDKIFQMINNMHTDGGERQISYKLKEMTLVTKLAMMAAKVRSILVKHEFIQGDLPAAESNIVDLLNRTQTDTAYKLLRRLDLKKPETEEFGVQVNDMSTHKEMQRLKDQFVQMNRQVKAANEVATAANDRLSNTLRDLGIARGERDRNQELYTQARSDCVDKQVECTDLEAKLSTIRVQITTQMQKEIQAYKDAHSLEKSKVDKLKMEIIKLEGDKVKLNQQMQKLKETAMEDKDDYFQIKSDFENYREMVKGLLPRDPYTQKFMTVGKKQIILAVRQKLAQTMLKFLSDQDYAKSAESPKKQTKQLSAQEQQKRGQDLAEKLVSKQADVVKKLAKANELKAKKQKSEVGEMAQGASIIESDMDNQDDDGDVEGVSKGLDTVHRNSIEMSEGPSQHHLKPQPHWTDANQAKARTRSINPNAKKVQLESPKNNVESSRSASVTITPVNRRVATVSVWTQTNHTGPIELQQVKQKLTYQYPEIRNTTFKLEKAHSVVDSMPMRAFSYLGPGQPQPSAIMEASRADSESETASLNSQVTGSRGNNMSGAMQNVAAWTKMKAKKMISQKMKNMKTSPIRDQDNDYVTTNQSMASVPSPPKRGQAGQKLLEKMSSSMKKRSQMNEIRLQQMNNPNALSQNDALSFGNQTVSHLGSARSGMPKATSPAPQGATNQEANTALTTLVVADNTNTNTNDGQANNGEASTQILLQDPGSPSNNQMNMMMMGDPIADMNSHIAELNNQMSYTNMVNAPQISVQYKARSININTNNNINNKSNSPNRQNSTSPSQVQKQSTISPGWKKITNDAGRLPQQQQQQQHQHARNSHHGINEQPCLACLIEEYQAMESGQHSHVTTKLTNQLTAQAKKTTTTTNNIVGNAFWKQAGDQSDSPTGKGYQSRNINASNSRSPKRNNTNQSSNPRTIKELKEQGMISRDMSPEHKRQLLQPTIVHSQFDREQTRKQLKEQIEKLREQNLKMQNDASQDSMHCHRHKGQFWIQNGINEVDGPTQRELAKKQGFQPSEQIRHNENLQPRINMESPERKRSQSPPNKPKSPK